MKVKKIIVLLLVAILLVNCNILLVNAVSLQEQKSDLNEQKKAAEAQQDDVQEEMSSEMQEVEELSTDISNVENEISTLKLQLEEVETSIDEKTKEIEKKQEEYDSNQKLLEERLVTMYETSNTSFLDLLLSSTSIVDFISNYYLMEQIVEFDTELLETIEKEQQEIEQAKQELETKKQEVEEIKQQQESKASELKTKKAERQTKIDALSEQNKQLQSEIDDYNAKLKEVDNAIAAALKKAMEEEQKRNEQSSNGSSGSSSSGGSSKFDGTFAWPCPGYTRVTSRMKYRWGRWHKGIDIGTGGVTGKTVVASAAGTVIYRAYQSGTSASPGYGNYVIIYHGNGFCSLYAHMNSVSVSMGQSVSQGQTIGYSGNTGGVAPHLHFEIRKASSVSNFFGNNWLDPLDYLPNVYTIVD